MLKFNTDAKLTHTKYGIKSNDAVILILLKSTILIRIINQSTMITIKANPGECQRKNTKDHKAFIRRWIIKNIIANFTPEISNPSFQIRNKEIPIIKYRIVHTGPNIQFGGLKEGLFRN